MKQKSRFLHGIGDLGNTIFLYIFICQENPFINHFIISMDAPVYLSFPLSARITQNTFQHTHNLLSIVFIQSQKNIQNRPFYVNKSVFEYTVF